MRPLRQRLQLVQIIIRSEHCLYANFLEQLDLLGRAGLYGDIKGRRTRVLQEACKNRTSNVTCPGVCVSSRPGCLGCSMRTGCSGKEDRSLRVQHTDRIWFLRNVKRLDCGRTDGRLYSRIGGKGRDEDGVGKLGVAFRAPGVVSILEVSGKRAGTPDYRPRKVGWWCARSCAIVRWSAGYPPIHSHLR